MKVLKRSSSLFLIFCLIPAFLSVDLSTADELDEMKKALDIISEFAEKLCKDVPITGSAENLELTGDAKAELNKILKKIADVGIKGAVKYQKSEYQGLLQKDLAQIITSERNCRLAVWNDLKMKIFNNNDDRASSNQKDLQRRLHSLLKPPFATKTCNFTHGPADCKHHATETLSIVNFTVNTTGLSCSYAVNKTNVGKCRGLPFNEVRPTFYGHVLADLQVQNSRVKIYNIKDKYPQNLEQDTKAGSAIIDYLNSINGSIIP